MTDTMTRRQALATLSTLTGGFLLGCRPDSLLSPDLDAAQLGPGSVTLFGAGDQHAQTTNAVQTGRMIKAALDRDPSAYAFNAGDLVYSGTSTEYQQQYEPMWGGFKARTFFAQGNHDRQADPTGVAYWNYVGDQGGPRGKGWYGVTLGAWRLRVLNSEQAWSKEQIAWLTADCAGYKHLHGIAMWHTPMVASVCAHHGRAMTLPGPLGVWWQLLQDAGTELVVTGHVHRYERFPRMTRNGTASPTGIRQFTCGTGGVKPMEVLRPHPLSQRRIVSKGMLKLVLHSDRYQWAFTDTAGVVRDKGTQMCRV